MSPHKTSTEIFNAAGHYCSTGDLKPIEKFTHEEIDLALTQHFSDKNSREYAFLEKRSSELKDKEKNKRSKREKWIDRLIGFIKIFLS